MKGIFSNKEMSFTEAGEELEKGVALGCLLIGLLFLGGLWIANSINSRRVAWLEAHPQEMKRELQSLKDAGIEIPKD